MGEVGCYSLDLYCDHPDHDRYRDGAAANYTGRTYSECAREARAAGWAVNRKAAWGACGVGRCLCPTHNPRRKPK